MVKRNSSKGCIILPDPIRNLIGRSRDPNLQVIP